MDRIVYRCADCFCKIAGERARSLFLDLQARGEIELTAWLLRTHLFHYGLFGNRSVAQSFIFLEKNETEQIALDTAKKHRGQHVGGRLLWGLWDMNPVHTMLNTGVWDEACRDRV